MKKVFLSFATVALAVASAAGSATNVTLFEKAFIGGEELKPGDYKIAVSGDKATLKNGKKSVEATVKTTSGDQKFSTTSIRYGVADGKNRVEEIRLGGTKTTLVFTGEATAAGSK